MLYIYIYIYIYTLSHICHLHALIFRLCIQMFSAAELGVMLCGERVINWDREALEKHLKLVSNEQASTCVRLHAYVSACVFVYVCVCDWVFAKCSVEKHMKLISNRQVSTYVCVCVNMCLFVCLFMCVYILLGFAKCSVEKHMKLISNRQVSMCVCMCVCLCVCLLVCLFT